MERIGEYEIIRKLGQGGMAEVFLAEKPLAEGLKKRVVIKCMLPHLRSYSEYSER
jgi:serine/threonine-protein kinase